MDLKRKIEYAKRAIESITRHHDATVEEVEQASAEVHAHVDTELREMPERRKAHEAAIEAEAAQAAKLQAEKAKRDSGKTEDEAAPQE